MKFKPSLHKLPNGLPVILDPMDMETATMSVVFKTGGRDESKGDLGITHFLEHMIMSGTPTRPSPKSIRDFMENHGGTINAGTSNASFRLSARIIAENLFVLAEVLADNIKNPLFDPAALENEKTVILDEYMRSQDDPDRRFFYFSVKNLFAGSGYANETLGSVDTIKSFTRERLLNWKSARFSALNSVIAISGKITDKAGLLSKLEELFGWLPALDVPSNSAAEFKECAAHNPRPDKNVKISIAIEDLVPFGLEYRFKNMCLGRFGSALQKRLFEIIRNKNGLVYGIYGDSLGNESAGADTITTSASPENAAKVVALAAQVSADMMFRNPYSAAELEQRNQRAKLGDADFLESAGERKNKLIDFYLDYGQLFDYYESLELSDKITVAAVIENARDMFNARVSVITQGADVDAEALRRTWLENFK